MQINAIEKLLVRLAEERSRPRQSGRDGRASLDDHGVAGHGRERDALLLRHPGTVERNKNRGHIRSELRRCNKIKCQILFHDKPTTLSTLKKIIPDLKKDGHSFARQL